MLQDSLFLKKKESRRSYKTPKVCQKIIRKIKSEIDQLKFSVLSVVSNVSVNMQKGHVLFIRGFPLGPGRTRQIFVYFAKKSVISSLRQVRPVIFRSNFVKAYQTSKTPSGVKSDRFVNLQATI